VSYFLRPLDKTIESIYDSPGALQEIAMIEHPRILVVDDEPDILDILVPFFEQEGYIVAVAADGAEALVKAAQFNPHVILLDVLLPDITGREVLRRLRQKDSRVGVIMISKTGGPIERGRTIQEGAEDYITKPFEPFEVLARVQRFLRSRAANQPSLGTAPRLRCGELLLDRRAGAAYLRGERLDLTPRTLAVLEYLMAHPGELITRERLLNVVWGYDDATGDRILDNRIWDLRRQLQDDPRAPRYIETVSGQGYRFKGEVEALA
jgi:DNA-binding response OmpR family regulator